MRSIRFLSRSFITNQLFCVINKYYWILKRAEVAINIEMNIAFQIEMPLRIIMKRIEYQFLSLILSNQRDYSILKPIPTRTCRQSLWSKTQSLCNRNLLFPFILGAIWWHNNEWRMNNNHNHVIYHNYVYAFTQRCFEINQKQLWLTAEWKTSDCGDRARRKPHRGTCEWAGTHSVHSTISTNCWNAIASLLLI